MNDLEIALSKSIDAVCISIGMNRNEAQMVSNYYQTKKLKDFEDKEKFNSRDYRELSNRLQEYAFMYGLKDPLTNVELGGILRHLTAFFPEFGTSDVCVALSEYAANNTERFMSPDFSILFISMILNQYRERHSKAVLKYQHHMRDKRMREKYESLSDEEKRKISIEALIELFDTFVKTNDDVPDVMGTNYDLCKELGLVKGLSKEERESIMEAAKLRVAEQIRKSARDMRELFKKMDLQIKDTQDNNYLLNRCKEIHLNKVFRSIVESGKNIRDFLPEEYGRQQQKEA